METFNETGYYDNEANYLAHDRELERAERRREAAEAVDYYAETAGHSELPAIFADDAGPIGASCEVPVSSGHGAAWRNYFAILAEDEKLQRRPALPELDPNFKFIELPGKVA